MYYGKRFTVDRLRSYLVMWKRFQTNIPHKSAYVKSLDRSRKRRTEWTEQWRGVVEQRYCGKRKKYQKSST